jgi:hypothetical protein
VENVKDLQRLAFIPDRLGLVLTLLATYPVVMDGECQKILTFWRQERGAELGIHLHPWCTPPFGPAGAWQPWSAARLSKQWLDDKVGESIAALRRQLGVSPGAFRMGRFEIDEELLERLRPLGIKVDSSIVPLRSVVGGPDHFLAPADPYFIPCEGFSAPLLEVPVTQVAVIRNAPGAVYRLARRLPSGMGRALLSNFRHIGVLGIHPAWFPLESMKQAVRLHHRRGGRVLNLFMHSSELHPGATPTFQSERAVRHLVRKLDRFLTWLTNGWQVQGVTLSQLYPEDSEACDQR